MEKHISEEELDLALAQAKLRFAQLQARQWAAVDQDFEKFLDAFKGLKEVLIKKNVARVKTKPRKLSSQPD